MKTRKFKILAAAFFMFIFCLKMALSVAPVFLNLDKKVVNAVIMQLEHDSKTDKDDLDKDLLKDKKAFDDSELYSAEYITFLVETKVLHNLEHALYTQIYHPVVPTPPPNA
jgi:hypothetical protein